MQKALVKLLGVPGTVAVTPENRDKLLYHPTDKHCVRLALGKVISLKDGEKLDSLELSANQSVLVYPSAEVSNPKYHLIVSLNPELAKAGVIATPFTLLVSPKEGDQVGALLRTTKKVDLDSFGYIFKLSALD